MVHEYFKQGIRTPVLMTVLAIRERSSFLRLFSSTKLEDCCVFHVPSSKFMFPMHVSVSS